MLIGSILFFAIIIIAVLTIFLSKKNNSNNQDSAQEPNTQVQTTTVSFAPPVDAVGSNTPETFSSKIIFSDSLTANKIMLEIKTDPTYVSDILLSLNDFENWTIEDGFYDSATGTANITIIPATGFSTSQIKDAVIIVDTTSKSNIQNVNAQISITQNSYIQTTNGNMISITGEPYTLIYPDVAPAQE